MNAEKTTHMSQGSDEHIPHIEPTLKWQYFKQRQHRVANVVEVEAPRVGPGGAKGKAQIWDRSNLNLRRTIGLPALL